MAFKMVDLPALVYPTRATDGVWEALRLLRWVTLCFLIVWSSFLHSVMRWLICLRSSSSFFSPAPLLERDPLPPPCLDMAVPIPDKRGRRYWSLASSTCNLASRLRALDWKISRMSAVRSKMGSPISRFKLRACDGDKALSKMIRSASKLAAASLTSCTLPEPI